ncbi:dihydrolipoyl dehydrogenase [Caldinitratiruptor microaerophilus]|uniref:Dihydrolipoyl dehydrogenase n=1 Tax=Caldinitratiruptor microaerophilus TaxID=671077 RepID=A0AA35CIG3_9FIRM|nr:dihydrolipoyl dehydrogenase [Caldinitratiruptor microaerophilus]BDG59049.1 dihydrolipoamide dehydrogenase [Caldinitratiruptor microaerophilus]
MVVGQIANGTEVLVIGGGPGGYHAAATAARAGKEVVLVEASLLGGTCLNCGCIPSKALIQATRRASPVSPSGVPPLAEIQAWKRQVVDRLRRGVEQTLKQAGVTLVQGRATFTGPDRVSVETAQATEVYRFRHCIIATGSVPAFPPGFAPDGEGVCDAAAALEWTEPPEELVILGAGYIGLELGTAFAKLGSRVTVLEVADQILPGLDAELTRPVARHLEKLGVKVHLGVRATGWEREGGRIVVRAEGVVPPALPADRVLVATGRLPNIRGLGLEKAGIALDECGYVRADDQCRTNVPRIYAIGDVAGGPLLAHKATREAEVAAAAIAGHVDAMDPAGIPAVIFTEPEVATVGLTEAEARARGYRVVTGRFPLTASGRAWTLGEPDGFVKVVGDGDTGVLLGAQMVGPEVSELIAAATLALELGARVEDVALTLHPHPTLAEAFMAAAADAAAKRR